MVWLERRAYGSEGGLSARQYRWIGTFTSGSCTGLIVATISLFHAQLLLPVSTSLSTVSLGMVFFGSWGVATCWAVFRPNAYIATRELLFAAGILAMAVMPVNGLSTGDWVINSLSQGHWITAGVDLSLLAGGLLMILAARSVPSQRPLRDKTTRAEQARQPTLADADYDVEVTP